MKPRPFYRWKSFWLGLCVLVFFGWGWWDSGKNAAGFTAPMGGNGLLVVRLRGSTWLLSGRYMGQGWSAYRAPAASAAQWDAEVSTYEANGYRWIRIPDALVFFPLFTLWLGWLLCHWKREQKKLTP